MGSGISSEQFSSVKDKYEELKAGGLTDEALFDAIKAHLEGLGGAPAPAGEAPPADAPPADAPPAEDAAPPAEELPPSE
jgi:hypothetical protein